MKQDATTRNKALALDLTYGFPGKLPKGERLLQFFQHLAQGKDVRAAARAAGYSEHWATDNAYRKRKEFQDYERWLQAHFAQTAVKQAAVDQTTVLDEILRIALANEVDFIVVEGEGKNATARRKFVHELTREQLTAVEVFKVGKGVDWKWRNRDAMLGLAAKHFGLINDKLILERRNTHLHAHFDLSKVPIGKLEAMEEQFEKLLEIGVDRADATR